MQKLLPQELKTLATLCPTPLYVVGGSVRDFLAGLTPAKQDLDICAPCSAEEFAALATKQGFSVKAIYRNTGTVKLMGAESEYEFSSFRSDEYVRGTHTPVSVFFTTDITLDARRRDFTCNAVYYDIAKDQFVDPLDGITAIREKRMTTVDDAKKVFGEDGLRLMRLARQAAQLGFTPDKECLAGAKQNAALIADVSVERIFEELVAILIADQKCGVVGAPYHGLRLLQETGVLAHILPELALGDGLAQRADFHKYDVLEHSFRAVLYMEKLDKRYPLRLAALLHDVGKPTCMLREGNAHGHAEEGVALAAQILTRLKAPNRITYYVLWLIEWHMYDFNCQTGENKLRRFFVKNGLKLQDLLLLKQADFSACTDDTSTAPTCERWDSLLRQMSREHVPFSLKKLAVNGKALAAIGIPAPHIARVLDALLQHTAVCPQDNREGRLLRLAVEFDKNLK